MIAIRLETPRLTSTEYLAWEEQQKFRHEYVDGEIYDMTGGTVNHGKTAVNITVTLGNHLRDSECQVLNSDVKVQILESKSYFYPDISVTCDQRDCHVDQFISHPCLIVEVLSPSTEAYDRGKKFRKYLRSASLKEYVLVSTNEMCLDVYHLNERGKWELTTYGEGELVELKSVNLTVPIEQIYRNVVFAPENESTPQ